MKNGYQFSLDRMVLPITPSSLNISFGSKNETVDLINGDEINILKSPSLVEIEFEARFPMRDYPYSKSWVAFDVYYQKILELKESKQPFYFHVLRETPNGIPTWDTEVLVSLEEFEIDEDAEEGDDVLITFNLKQYKSYGTKVLKVKNNQIQPSPTESKSDRVTKQVTQTSYTIKSGDTLWGIAKKHYGDGSKWTTIYNANKTIIEEDAKKHGKASSSNGHWIWPGLTILLPT